MAVLCRNMTNRKLMSSTRSLDYIADAFEACQRSYARTPAVSGPASAAISLIMHVFVVLVSLDTNVARHLVEREGFMPLLFVLLRTGVLRVSVSLPPCFVTIHAACCSSCSVAVRSECV